MVKLASSMRRYGVDAGRTARAARGHRRTPVCRSPASGCTCRSPATTTAVLAEIEAWLPLIPADAELWVSHLATGVVPRAASPHTRATVPHPGRHRAVARHSRVPTSSASPPTCCRLDGAAPASSAGYHHTPAPFDGTLSPSGRARTHGIALLDDADPARRSPFHFQRQRLTLLERPHMHTSLAVVPDGQPCPQVGDWVDVQRPLITHPDRRAAVDVSCPNAVEAVHRTGRDSRRSRSSACA